MDNFLKKLKKVLKELGRGKRQRDYNSQEAHKRMELILSILTEKQRLIRKTRTVDRALYNISRNVERVRTKTFIKDSNQSGEFTPSTPSKQRNLREEATLAEEDNGEPLSIGNPLVRTMSHHLGPRHYNRRVSMVSKKQIVVPDFFNEETIMEEDSERNLWGIQSKFDDSFDGMPLESQSDLKTEPTPMYSLLFKGSAIIGIELSHFSSIISILH